MRVEKPDLVVLDVMMPSIDGPTMLKRKHAKPFDPMALSGLVRALWSAR